MKLIKLRPKVCGPFYVSVELDKYQFGIFPMLFQSNTLSEMGLSLAYPFK